MLRSRLRHSFVAGLAILASLTGGSSAFACPFCSNMGKTLAENINEAAVVVYAELSNARQIPGDDPDRPAEATDMTVLRIIKNNPALANRKQITLPRFIAAAEKEKVNYVVFAEVLDGKIDPYRGMPVDQPEFVDYLAGSLSMAKASAPEKLGFFFRYLDNKDENIAGDAYKEFAAAPYADVVAASKKYDAKKLVAWIRDKETPSYRIGLYGCLLGTCGQPSDAAMLREIVANPATRPLTGVDGLMGGYCILDPAHGPAYVIESLSDLKNDFNFRYACLRTVRFLMTELPTLDKKPLFAGLVKAVQVPDISDLVIDELRKNKEWSAIDQVLAIYGDKKFDQQVIRRAVIRFALKCPSPAAASFVAKLRKQDAQLVADVEEILKFEESQQIISTPPSTPAPAGNS